MTKHYIHILFILTYSFGHSQITNSNKGNVWSAYTHSANDTLFYGLEIEVWNCIKTKIQTSTIYLKKNDSIIQTIILDTNYQYHFVNIEKGTYTIKVESKGYKPLEIKNVVIKGGTGTKLYFELVQTDENKPNSIWIDKPVVKSDTLLLTTKKIRKIKVYEGNIKDNDKGRNPYDTFYIGSWLIVKTQNEITSCFWEGNFSNWLETISSTKYTENIITDIIGKNDHQYILTHYMDKKGTIIKSKNTIKSKYESRYYFTKIYYKYKDGLVIEANYTSDKNVPKNIVYSKYIFEHIFE